MRSIASLQAVDGAAGEQRVLVVAQQPVAGRVVEGDDGHPAGHELERQVRRVLGDGERDADVAPCGRGCRSRGSRAGRGARCRCRDRRAVPTSPRSRCAPGRRAGPSAPRARSTPAPSSSASDPGRAYTNTVADLIERALEARAPRRGRRSGRPRAGTTSPCRRSAARRGRACARCCRGRRARAGSSPRRARRACPRGRTSARSPGSCRTCAARRRAARPSTRWPTASRSRRRPPAPGRARRATRRGTRSASSASAGNAAAIAERKNASFGSAQNTKRFSTPCVRARWSARRSAVLIPP